MILRSNGSPGWWAALLSLVALVCVFIAPAGELIEVNGIDSCMLCHCLQRLTPEC